MPMTGSIHCILHIRVGDEVCPKLRAHTHTHASCAHMSVGAELYADEQWVTNGYNRSYLVLRPLNKKATTADKNQKRFL